MTRPVHFEVEVLCGALFQPLCENRCGLDAFADLSADVEMTDDDSQVSCPRCLEALGYAVSAEEMRRAA